MSKKKLRLNNLKKLRLINNYSLDEIEAMTGINRGTYNNYENGNTEPKLDTWEKLAEFYEVSPAFLVGWEG